MKKVLSRVMSVCLALMVAFSMVIVPSVVAVHADGAVLSEAKYAKTVKYYVGAEYGELVMLNMGSKLKGAKSVKITSSKKSVVKPFSYQKGDGNYIILNLKKKGTAKLTITVKKSGKTAKYKTTVKVLKYSNPFQSFKIGQKSVTTKFKKTMVADYNNKINEKQKISIKVKSGKKIKKITYCALNFETEEEINKTIKNNSSVKLIKDNETWMESITVTVYDSKTKTTSWFSLYL